MEIFSYDSLLVVVSLVVILFSAWYLRSIKVRKIFTPISTTEVTLREMVKRYKKELCDAPLPDMSHLVEDPACAPCLDRFAPLQHKSGCLFAKTAKMWGSTDWKYDQSLEWNIERSIPALIAFVQAGKCLHLDGFLIEIRGPQYFATVEEFGQSVRRTLKVISDRDPGGARCMDRKNIDRKGWFFEFCKESFFITTFAPCYPETSSRYCYDASPDSCWILLQPEYSFVWKDLPSDTPHTNWDHPETIRDRIRVEFKKKGQLYDIPDTIFYPPAHHVVKPLQLGMPIVEWWKAPATSGSN